MVETAEYPEMNRANNASIDMLTNPIPRYTVVVRRFNAPNLLLYLRSDFQEIYYYNSNCHERQLKRREVDANELTLFPLVLPLLLLLAA